MSRFHPKQFVHLAEKLVAQRDEACLRSAVSRAYYGVFLQTRELLQVTLTSATVHAETQRLLKRRGLPRLAQDMERLRKLRNQSDYQLDDSLDLRMIRESAQRAVQTARLIARELEAPALLHLFKARAAPSSPAHSRPGPPGRGRR
ncbi:hypothetical protein DES44_1660 [Roseateles depolymerans]|uniref:Uncharacterized protein n=2 Tax=Roseateles depolymerans TaxID=76731 RepID=A0A0U3LMQ2_9BURK|nr:hypothetical protein RD2015_1717 [Roseateles depolymerans]REG19168.1 hypothetical protein DES44_1660 [Roseateles depolymerans]